MADPNVSRTFHSARNFISADFTAARSRVPILTRLNRLTVASRLFSRLCNFGQSPITRVHMTPMSTTFHVHRAPKAGSS
jgi:hypothetical protein